MAQVTAVFANARQTRDLAEGEVLFHENDPGTEMFGVISGEVTLYKGERVVVTIGEGGVFGEIALIDQSPRTLTARATAPSTLAVIDRRTFLFLVTETPTFALQVMSSLTERLRSFD